MTRAYHRDGTFTSNTYHIVHGVMMSRRHGGIQSETQWRNDATLSGEYNRLLRDDDLTTVIDSLLTDGTSFLDDGGLSFIRYGI